MVGLPGAARVAFELISACPQGGRPWWGFSRPPMGGGAFLPRRGRLLLRVVVLAFVAVAVASFVVPPLTGHVAGQVDD
jgi:hypothetical protein